MANQEPSNPAGQLIIEPKTSWYDSGDDRWLAQVNELRAALGPYLALSDDASASPQAGQKGAAELGGALVILLSAPTVLPVVLEAMQAWLDKDRTRSIKVSRFSEDGNDTLEVTGTGMRSAEIRQAMIIALAKQDERDT